VAAGRRTRNRGSKIHSKVNREARSDRVNREVRRNRVKKIKIGSQVNPVKIVPTRRTVPRARSSVVSGDSSGGYEIPARRKENLAAPVVTH
jgi:hypothetical protein